MGKVTALANNINLEFDKKTREYYIIWEPIVIGMGKTSREALEDLREAAHFGVDTLIDLKLKDIKKED
jgi:predicted RNase H-like HicB family nuclease